MVFEYGLPVADLTRGAEICPLHVLHLIDLEAIGEKTNSALLEWLEHALAEDIVTIFADGYGFPESSP
jgi:hypothetical protein